jgi:UDP-N-acetylglucosamine 2-epimerase (non-hydrolysing)
MKKIVLIIGARPNFMKAFPVYEALKEDFDLTLIHTGQHYDEKMSKVFFEELKFPYPDIHLNLDKKTKAGDFDEKLYVNNIEYLQDKDKVIQELIEYKEDLGQLGEIRDKLLVEFQKIKPDMVIVFGDVTSTLSASLSAKMLDIEIAHIESGLRSGDLSMPEEVNRILTDHITNYYFVTEQSGVDNLEKEGKIENVYLVGNTMIDTQKKYLQQAIDTRYHKKLGLNEKEYILITLHRPSNVDNLEKLKEIFDDLIELSKNEKLVYPIHPRTKGNLEKLGYLELIMKNENIVLEEPLGYLEFTCLMANCKYLVTDSGGLQEESTALDIPCFTLRENTERPCTLIENQGTNQLINKISEIMLKECKGKMELIWDGKSSNRINAILKNTKSNTYMFDIKNIINNNITDTSEDITVIVSVYSRPDYFDRLITELDKVKYHSIWISCWFSPNYQVFREKYEKLKKTSKNKLYFFSSNFQLKYFGRFQLAYQVSTKYTLILDDDCLIQPKFHELCLKMINMPEYNGLLGVKGWVFPEKNENNLLDSYGAGKFYYPKPAWKKEEDTKYAFEIDIVGGAWFFRKEWILYMFREFPFTFETGEDFHFSYMLRKYAGIKTYFIPNDNNYKEYWGCSSDFSTIDMAGNSRSDSAGEIRKLIFWKQYLGLCPFVKRIKEKIKLLIITNHDEYYLSRLLKNRKDYLILILSKEDMNIHENNFYLNDLDNYENFNITNNFTAKYPKKLNCLILNGFLQNHALEIKSYLNTIGNMFNNLFDYSSIHIFNMNEIIQYFNISDKKICVYDKYSIQNISLYSETNIYKKFFKGEINYFNFLLKNNVNFSVVRIGDGECNILHDIDIDMNQYNWLLNDDVRKTNLYKRFKILFKNVKHFDNFYIGVPCPCCMNEYSINFIKEYLGTSFRNYTWGNIFVNNNYNYTMSTIYEKTLKDKKIVLICNENSNVLNLKLNIIKTFYISSSWYNEDDLLNSIVEYAKNIENKIFLFAAGPFSKIAIFDCYEANKNNTYLDIGSIFNKILLNTNNRGYLKGSSTLNKCCRWKY